MQHFTFVPICGASVTRQRRVERDAVPRRRRRRHDDVIGLERPAVGERHARVAIRDRDACAPASACMTFVTPTAAAQLLARAAGCRRLQRYISLSIQYSLRAAALHHREVAQIALPGGNRRRCRPSSCACRPCLHSGDASRARRSTTPSDRLSSASAFGGAPRLERRW